MAINDHPLSLKPENMEWGSTKAGVQFRSPFDASVEAIEFPGEFWTLAIGYPPMFDSDSGLLDSFWSFMAGGSNKVRVWHFKRPVPLGSMRGLPTLAVSVARGALSLQITTDGGLKAGDFFKIGNQLFRALFDCDAVGGVLTVQLVQRVRAALSAGASVQWDRPTATFIFPSKSFSMAFASGVTGRVQVDLVESP
ncbi:MAG: hypothetical protein EOP35_02560 [Rubrivivax sp.]|nr:MAG: hypothetical protein EOP35_02560 [Rubrivivax sp.]